MSFSGWGGGVVGWGVGGGGCTVIFMSNPTTVQVKLGGVDVVVGVVAI